MSAPLMVVNPRALFDNADLEDLKPGRIWRVDDPRHIAPQDYPSEHDRERIRAKAQVLAFREVHDYARKTFGMVMVGNVDELYRLFKEREAELVDSLTAQHIIEKGL